MIYILHISDLHFLQNPNSNIMVEQLLRMTKEKMKDVPQGQKLLIVTGDFHEFRDKDYTKAEVFLMALSKAMDLDMTKDIFVVPGNNDVGNYFTLEPLLKKKSISWKKHIDLAVNMIKSGDMSYIPERLPAFRPYCNFVRKLKIYGTAKDPDGPAKTYLRSWRGKLNILHLNTALVADGLTQWDQITDTGEAASSKLWSGYDQEDIPTIAIGHHSIYELQSECRKELTKIFLVKNVKAYMSGAKYQFYGNSNFRMIPLLSSDMQNIEIPDLVAFKDDTYTLNHFSMMRHCWHEWDDTTGKVKAIFERWNRFANQFFEETKGESGWCLTKLELKRREIGKFTPLSPIEQEKPDSKLKEYLNKLLINEISHHTKLFMMQNDAIDIQKSSEVKRIKSFVSIGKTIDSRNTFRVWDFIQDSWEKDKKHNIVIEGVAGIGKTVTLFNVVNLSNDDVPPAVYVPLYKLINEKGECINISQYLLGLSDEYGRKILQLASSGWKKGPKLLILLDGFNEVPDYQRRTILHMINEWWECTGAQLIVTSRPMHNINLSRELVDDPLTIILEPLSRESVRDYLGEQTPPDQSPLWKVLTLPIFLKLYHKFAKLKGLDNIVDKLALKNTESEGDFFWNYLQIQLLRNESEAWVLRCAFACEYFLPYIAYSMIKEQSYYIEKDRALVIIKTVLEDVDQKKLPHHLMEILDWYKNRMLCEPDLSSINWYETILNDVGLLIEHQNGYFFAHQFFRDIFAGLYLVNLAEMMKDGDSLAKEWYRVANDDVINYAADLMGKEEVEKLWKANRIIRPTDSSSTYTILELLRRRKDIEDLAIDFSGMDLRDLNLTHYLLIGTRNGKSMKLFRNANLSKKTLFNESTFHSPGHEGTVNCIGVVKDGVCVSGSDDSTLRIWDSNTGHCLKVLRAEQNKKWITCLTILQDSRIVSGSYDGTVRVWDSNLEHCLRILNGHTEQITCVAGLTKRLIVSGSYDRTLRIWDSDTGKCIDVLYGHKYGILCVAVSQNGKIISGSSDNTLRIWDSDTLKCLNTLSGHTDWIRCVAIHPNGQIISGSYDSTLRVWDADSGKCLQILNGHTECVRCVLALSDGRVVSGSLDHTLRVWDIFNGKCLQVLKGHEDEITCITDLLDGRVASGSSDCTLRVWDTFTGKCLQNQKGHTDWISSMNTLPNLCIVSGSIDKTLRIWDSFTGECLWVLERYKNAFNIIDVHPDGQIVSASDDGILRLWDINTEKCIQTFKGNQGKINSVAFLPDGRIVSGSDDGTLRVWDVVNGQCEQIIEGHHGRINCVISLLDGNVVSCSDDRTIRIWDVNTGLCKYSLEGHTGWVNFLAFHPNGYIISASSDGTLLVWDIISGHLLYRFEGHTKRITHVRILSDGSIITCSDDKTLRIWDVKTCICKHILKGHTGWITCMAVFSDGRVVSGADDNTLRVWDTISGTCLHILNGHEDEITCVNILPDGRVVSGSHDRTLRIWDAFMGNCLKTMEGHSGSITCLTVIPDGRVVSGSNDNTIRVWDSQTGECLNVFETLEVDVSEMDFSKAILTPALVRTLRQNGAKLS